MADDFWTKLHDIYSKEDWIAKPSLFAEIVIDYLPESGSILELGAGLGQDSAYFADHGYAVTSTDLNVDQLQKLAGDKFAVKAVDLREPLSFSAASFNVVYAHLSLHYFDHETTEKIFAEIYRVLKPNGILAFFTNSTSDPEYNTGQRVEDDYFNTAGTLKRYFSVESAKQFAHSFEPILADQNGETYKDSAKGIHNLIRYIGRKK
jgi:SAM-dependent methyltransferase